MICMATCNKTKADEGRLFTSDELTSSSVNCVTQDKLGFIWVGTEDGLNKFDGYRFEHFYSKSKDNTTISDNSYNFSCIIHPLSLSQPSTWTVKGNCGWGQAADCQDLTITTRHSQDTNSLAP